jgi:hypothetical protein
MKRATMLLAATALLAGCGGGAKTVTVSTPPKVAATSSSTATTTKPSPKTTVHLATFQTPSGNIGCMILDGLARCDIERRGWSPPARPADCPHEVDFGQGLEVGESGAARFVCAGDTVREPKAPKLAYGDSTQVATITCASAETGLTCRAGDGHGFFLSIQSYKLF